MYKLFVVYALIVIGAVLSGTEGARLLTVDSFLTGGSASQIIYVVPPHDGVPYTWYSPYPATLGDPVVKFVTTTDCIGGQRDLVLGYTTDTPEASVAIMNIVGRTGSISFPLDWIGGAYFQWDGFDDGGTGTAFPGAQFNPQLPTTLDISFGGRAQGFAMSITSDQDTDYRVRVINSGAIINTYRFTFPKQEGSFAFKIIYFSDPIWDTPGFNFGDVKGIEVNIQTGTGTDSNAPDTQFTQLFVFSFSITGTVGIRCNCGLTGFDSLLPNTQIDLKNAAGTTTIDTTLTDASGVYTFWALTPATYQVCYHDTTAIFCSPTVRCNSITIDPLTPAADNIYDFVVTRATTFTIPADITGDCSDCMIPDPTDTDPTCPPFATTTGCLGTTTRVTNYNDVPTGNTCTKNIARTWTSPDDGTQLTQHLTYRDTTAPHFDSPPLDLTQSCDSVTTSIQQWIAADASSTYSDDCTPVFLTNNYNNVPIGSCGFATVTFVVHDQCSHTSGGLTATYRVDDFIDPIIDTAASDFTVECDAKGNSVTSNFNTWLSGRAGAIGHDSCTTSFWSNDASSQPPLNPDACFDQITVTFTLHDQCSNTARTTAVFTVVDSTPAAFTTNPQNTIHECVGSPADDNSFNAWLSSGGFSVYTDACSDNDLDITLTNDFDTNTVFDVCGSSVAVTFFISDFCGNNAASAAATYTIRDTRSPVFTSFARDVTSECDGDGNFEDFIDWLNVNAFIAARDDCTVVDYSNDGTLPPASGCTSSVVVNFAASDQCGHTIFDQASFTIIDTTAPVFINDPIDSSAECNSDAVQAYADWLAADAGASVADSCVGATIINNAGVLALGCARTNVVTFRAQDDCLNLSAGVTATFTVTDTIPPLITSSGAGLDLDCNRSTNQNDYNNWLITHAGADAIDDCSTVSWTNDGVGILTPSCFFTEDVTFTASDPCGNSDFVVQTVVIVDNVPPILDFPAVDQDIQCDVINNPTSDQQYQTWIANHGFASAHDDCTAIQWTDDHVPLVGIDSCFASVTVTFVATDACAGHAVITTATFTARDTTPPVIITGAQTTTVQCDPTANTNQFVTWVQNHGNAVVQDSCSQITWSASIVPTPVGCGSVDVTFSADDGCGSVVVTTGTFAIIDTVPPTLVPAQNAQFQCDGTGNLLDYQNYVANHGGATAHDVCTTSITWTDNAPAAGPVGCGTTVITFTATDSCNQHTSSTGSFTIIDNFPPSIFPPAADQSAECDSNSNSIAIATWLLSHGGASATDSCYSTTSLNWSNNFSTLTPLPCGAVATVTFSVTDPCANVGRTTASFTVVDSVPPVITRQAESIVLECNADTNDADTLTWVNSRASASATDACSSVFWSNNFVATPDPCSGPYVVQYYATDVCGNRAITSASVTIDDTVPPEFHDFPEDVHVICDEITDSSVTGIPGFSDSCLSADVIRTETDSIEVLPFERLCPGDTIITRTWRLTDACGNIAERDQTIVVSIPQGPCIPQPCIPCEDQPLLCCASSIAPVPCNPVPCTPVDCSHASCSTVPCLPIVCSNGSPPPFQDDDDVIAPSPRPQPSECEPIYIYVFDDDDGVSTQPVYTVTFNSDASTLSYSLLFSLLIAFFILM